MNLGSQEQARGIEQVSKAIVQMEKVTQTTAANAEESASASEELSAQSDTLKSIVGRLNGMVGGGGESGNDRPIQRHRTGLAPSGRPGHGAGTGLTALRKAVSPKQSTVTPSYAEPVATAGHPDKNSFPLEEEFKEF